jgi:predicted DNA-binding helix-hairpin-helix protein
MNTENSLHLEDSSLEHVDWSWWRSNPVHLNSATDDEIRKLPGLTNDMVESIINFIKVCQGLTKKRLASRLKSEAMLKHVDEEIIIFDFKSTSSSAPEIDKRDLCKE